MRTNGRSRERILLYGLEGTGKSLAALDIASRVGPSRVFIIDNDNAWDRMLEGQTLAGEDVELAEEWRWDADANRGKGGWVEDDEWVVEGGNVVVYHTQGWVGNTSAIEEIRGAAGRDDWCVIDSGSALWSDVQAWFTEQVFDSSMEDYFLQVRMEKARAQTDAKSLGALDGWVDWPVINAQYKAKVMEFLVNPPCHLLVTAEQEDVKADDTDKETRALYSADLVKPRGQKRLGHNMQTILRLRRDRAMRFYVTTLKDRGARGELANEEVTDEGFATWYLEGVAGWSEDEPAPVIAKKAVKKIVKKG